ncbi:MAG: 50S ribosomal protein L23 [Patescibacteria group bacterium]
MALFGSNKKEKKAASPKAGEPRPRGREEKNAVSLGGNFKILKRPIISEKALGLESRGEYVFMVEPDANKPEVKKEIERKYGVKVERVNIMIYKSERVLFKGRVGSRGGFKKAMVKLAPGYKIEILPK